MSQYHLDDQTLIQQTMNGTAHFSPLKLSAIDEQSYQEQLHFESMSEQIPHCPEKQQASPISRNDQQRNSLEPFNNQQPKDMSISPRQEIEQTQYDGIGNIPKGVMPIRSMRKNEFTLRDTNSGYWKEYSIRLNSANVPADASYGSVLIGRTRKRDRSNDGSPESFQTSVQQQYRSEPHSNTGWNRPTNSAASPQRNIVYPPNLLTVSAPQSKSEKGKGTFGLNVQLKSKERVQSAVIPEWQAQYGINPYQVSQQNVQNIIKEMIFQHNPAIAQAAGMNAQQQQRGPNRIDQMSLQGFSQNLLGHTTAEDRNRILKKILTQFNMKVKQIEHKKFMNIFGLEIKQIPHQDLSKMSKAGILYGNSAQPQFNNKGLNPIVTSKRTSRFPYKNPQNQQQNLQATGPENEMLPRDGNQIQRSNSSSNSTHHPSLRIRQLNHSLMRTKTNSSSMVYGTDSATASNLDFIPDINISSVLVGANGEQESRVSLLADSNNQPIQNEGENQKEITEVFEDDQVEDAEGCTKNESLIIDNSSPERQKRSISYNQGSSPLAGGIQASAVSTASTATNSTRQNYAQSFVRRAQPPKTFGQQPQPNSNFKFAMSEGNQQREEIFFKKICSYRDFIFKINWSSNIFIANPVETPNYKMCVGRGNNGRLIKNCMKKRWWWQIVEFEEKNACHFTWTQLRQPDIFDRQTSLLQIHAESIDKLDTEEPDYTTGLYESRSKVVFSEIRAMMHSEGKKSNNPTMSSTTNAVFGPLGNNQMQQSPDKRNGQNQNGQVKTAINKQQNPFPPPADHNSKLFAPEDLIVYQKYMNSQNGARDYSNLSWDDLNFRLKNLKRPKFANVPYKMIEAPVNMNSVVHNHLQFNFHLGNKKALFYNMRQYYSLMKDDVFNYLPLTFHLTKGTSDKEYKHFLKKFKEIEDHNSVPHDSKKGNSNVKQPKNVWIVKPGEITNRGNGIQVCDNLTDIKRILGSKEKHPNGKEKTYIVQKYIDRPLLYNRRKFDIRAYMLITCVNGVLRGYWYQEGYIRTSGREFDLKDVSDVFIHLTNDAIQKDCEEYNKFEPGNKLSYFEFQRYLDIWYPEQKWNLFTQMLPKMKAIATDSIRATYIKLDPKRLSNNFEVFGLDFMIDEKFKPYLIEINTNPAIETTCPICLRVIPNMIENALRIGLDPLFPPPLNWPGQKKMLAPDSLTEHNRFEIIFDEAFDGLELMKIYRNQENCLEGVNDLDEDEEIDEEKSNPDNERKKVEIEYE